MTRSTTPSSIAQRVACLHRCLDATLPPDEWLMRYQVARRRLRLPKLPLLPEVVDHVQALLARDPTIRIADVRPWLGGGDDVVAALRDAIARRLDGQARKCSPRRVSPDSSATLIAWLRRQVGPMDLAELHRDMPVSCWPPLSQSARVLALRSPRLRLEAGLGLILRHLAAVGSNHISAMLCGWESLDAWLTDTYPEGDVGWQAIGTDVLVARWFAAQADERQRSYWRALAATSHLVGARLGDGTGPGLASAHRFVVPGLRICRQSKRVSQATCRARVQSRTARVTPLVANYPLLPRLAAQRFTDIETVRDIFDDLCRRRADGGDGGGRFNVSLEPAVGEASSDPRTLQFERITACQLQQRLKLPDRPVPLQPCYLVYHGERDQDDQPRSIFELYRRGALVKPGHRSAAQRAAWLPWVDQVHWRRSRASLVMFRFAQRQDRALCEQAFARGLVLIPIAELHYALAIAQAYYACSRCMGPRCHEFLQQEHSEQCFEEDPERPGCYRFWAISKGGVAPGAAGARKDDGDGWKRAAEPFLIDEPALKAVTAVCEIAQRNGHPPQPIGFPRHPDFGIRAFIHQYHGRIIPSSYLNSALATLLLGYDVQCYDLRHAFARFCEENGVPRSEIQAILHHDSPFTTAGYAPVSEAHKRQLMEAALAQWRDRIGRTDDRRAP